MADDQTSTAPPPAAGATHWGGPGADGVGRPAPPAPRRRPSMRPAFVVVAVAAVIVLGFGLLAVLSPPSTGPAPSSRPAKVAGTSLRAVPAAGALAPIEHPGTPPGNILDALSLPEGAVARSHQDLNTSSTQYDQQMTFSVRATEAAVVDFYKVRLKATGWSVFDTGPVAGHPGEVEVLAQKGGSDGWYWEVGAVVSPTTFGHGRTGGGQATAFTLRLFQQSDDD
jgi:hypothetical protein